jgi:hypothetical protein
MERQPAKNVQKEPTHAPQQNDVHGLAYSITRRRVAGTTPALRVPAPGRFEIDDQLVSGRLLHGQVGCLECLGHLTGCNPPS